MCRDVIVHFDQVGGPFADVSSARAAPARFGANRPEVLQHVPMAWANAFACVLLANHSLGWRVWPCGHAALDNRP